VKGSVKMKRLLCQDCLSFDFYTEQEVQLYFESGCGDDVVVCHSCGGELCHCSSCIETGNLLLSGERNNKKLGIKTSILKWNFKGGVENV